MVTDIVSYDITCGTMGLQPLRPTTTRASGYLTKYAIMCPEYPFSTPALSPKRSYCFHCSLHHRFHPLPQHVTRTLHLQRLQPYPHYLLIHFDLNARYWNPNAMQPLEFFCFQIFQNIVIYLCLGLVLDAIVIKRRLRRFR